MKKIGLFLVFIITVHVYQVINSLSPVCSYAIQKIPMDGCRITFSLWPHVIQHPSIGIFPYCVNKQGIIPPTADFRLTPFTLLMTPSNDEYIPSTHLLLISG